MPSWGKLALNSMITAMLQSEILAVNTCHAYVRWLMLVLNDMMQLKEGKD